MRNVTPPHNMIGSYCDICDTAPAGTWFLSYLCELGFINADDGVYYGHVTGKIKEKFLGLKKKHSYLLK